MSRRTVVQRLWAKTEVQADGCWLWTGGTSGGDPVDKYGRISVAGRMKYAHRVAYELLVGPIPAGHELDHLCRTRRCVNPDHLEPVTRRENLLRGDTLTAAHHEGRDCGFEACPGCARFRQERAA